MKNNIIITILIFLMLSNFTFGNVDHASLIQKVTQNIFQLNEIPQDILSQLLENGYQFDLDALHTLPQIENGQIILKHLLKKDTDSILKHEQFDFFLSQTIKCGRIDFLEILSGYGIALQNSDFDFDLAIGPAVESAQYGENKMLNYILNSFDAHNDPKVLVYAILLNNKTLYNNLLEQGYKMNPDPTAQINIYGFIRGMQLSDEFVIKYFLELGVNPNVANPMNNDYDSIFSKNNIELLDFLIAHGLKIELLHIAQAAQCGSLNIIKYFHEKGYNIKHPGVFVAACGSYSYSKNVEEFNTHVRLTNITYARNIVIEQSARNKEKLVLIDFLLENGANINDPNALKAAVRQNNFERVKYLIERGANPINQMAINTAVRSWDENLTIAKYLVEQGAQIEFSTVINAGLGGNSVALRWVLEQIGAPITSEIEEVLKASQEAIVKFTLQHLVPKDAILIGSANEGYHFTDGISGVAAKLMEQNPNIFVVPITEQIAQDDSLMLRFSGFVTPGAGDSYPRGKSTFSLKDMDFEQMKDYEQLYLRIVSFAKKHDIPYLGICLGSQYLILDSEGHLQFVHNHGGQIVINFEKGSIPHFMTLLPEEKAKALFSCHLEDIVIENAPVAHGYAGVKGKLGNKIKLGAISKLDENVPESFSHGHNQIGIQFHPERVYFKNDGNEVNRQKLLLDSFFKTSINYQKSRKYALKTGFHHSEVKDTIYNANQELIDHLESCVSGLQYSPKKIFWGNDLGSYEVDVKEIVQMLMGVTANDIALARDGEDLVLIIKSSGDMLSIQGHFAKDGEHRVKSIDFADGSCIILEKCIFKDGFSFNSEDQTGFHRNATQANKYLNAIR